MFIAAADEGEEAPPDEDAFRGVVGRPCRHPDGEADEPVAERRARDEREYRSALLCGRDTHQPLALRMQHRAAAAPDEDQGEGDASGEIADPGQAPARG